MPNLPTTIDAAFLLGIPGIAAVVWVIMTAVRQAVTAPWFNQWAPLIAIVLGTALGAVFTIILGTDVTNGKILLGAVSGLIGGFLSQNVNNAIQRARGNVPPSSP